MSQVPDLLALGGRINTGADDLETSRALIVFNTEDVALSGTAVFFASMSWSVGTPLPPVAVTDMAGAETASAVTNMGEGPDRLGRSDRRQLAFELRFAVTDVPAQGWKTYLAAYSDRPASQVLAYLPDKQGLLVVETTRHGGDLPATGTFSLLPGVSLVVE